MATSNTTASIQNRPYRSHRVPACTRCRSRKIRCQIDIPNEPCLFCRERQLKCQYVDSGGSPENGERRPAKRSRPSNSDSNGNGDAMMRSLSAPVLHKPTTAATARIMLAPHVAEDIDILQRHISQHRPADGEIASNTYQTLSHDASNPIIYLSVPRFRAGLRPESGAGKKQLEIIEQILGPFKQEVVELYFQHIHYHFPIIDDESYFALKQSSLDKVPKNMMCVVYAIAMPHWRRSDALKLHPRPEAHYMWNKAISAVLEDFLSPGLSTVSAAVIDLVGRPSVSIVGNTTLCGRTVSLAQTFGLHRDPSNWTITPHEKSARIRLWWGVLITDYWSSIAYGAPPHIVKGFYDVPMPTLDSLVSSKASLSQKYASTCFIHLCALTELLGDILPLVYHIRPKPQEFEDAVQRLTAVLDYQESQLPEWLPLPNRTGTSNLWFCFLSIRLLLGRVALRAAVLTGDEDLQCTRLRELRKSTAAVLDFVLYLGESQFLDFWIPHVAHLLVLAVMIALRCAVEASKSEDRNTAITRLERVIAHIQHARDNYDWDIANYCIERCSDSISKIASLAAREPQAPPEAEVRPVETTDDSLQLPSLEDPSFLLSDILDPNAFDFFLWDTPSGMPNFGAD
ncbi:C6 transcription factor-like protein [Lophiotrema nucula]|uniref:C6 transcription factor-like protein n=1 Tax=Lophiotrema nucula TaxID=690887 RepID=A0A6A5YQK3_9PLEO|nr:C6 transcription factor-like protein [Lophiotrema nucula]